MAATAKADYQPQCAALTADGKQCRNSARGASKYCASHKGYQPPAGKRAPHPGRGASKSSPSHKGYQPPAGKGLAQRIEGDAWSATDRLTDRQSARQADPRPKVRRAEDTPLAVRSKAKGAGGK